MTRIIESTGLPTGTSNLRLRVIPASDTAPLRIQYTDTTNQVLFTQIPTLPVGTPIRLSDTLS